MNRADELQRLEAQLVTRLTGVRAELKRINDTRSKARQAVTVWKSRSYRDADGAQVTYTGQVARPMQVDGMDI